MEETTIDERGRIVVPQPIRERLDIHAGTIFEIKEAEDKII
ncbi:MAG: AbrB/MazE/SpoVT family DNA-binding domain-containing protein [Candidatus Hydrothermarchaeales archaeon]